MGIPEQPSLHFEKAVYSVLPCLELLVEVLACITVDIEVELVVDNAFQILHHLP